VRFVVQVKSETSQAAAVVFRARDLLVRRRTQIINALRGHLAQFELAVAKGPTHVGRLTALAADQSHSLPEDMRPVLGVLIETLHLLDDKAAVLDAGPSHRGGRGCAPAEDCSQHRSRHSSGDQALAPPPQTFAARDFAARLGLTPLQRSTGGSKSPEEPQTGGRAHFAPPVDHRGKRSGALGYAQRCPCGVMVGAHAPP
jgi:transposase